MSASTRAMIAPPQGGNQMNLAQQIAVFDASTRRKVVQLANIVKPTGGGTVQIQIPRTGLLSHIFLAVRGSISGTLSAPNSFGFSSVISSVRLYGNQGIDIFNLSGQGYHYLQRMHMELGQDVNPLSNARSAVTAATFNDDMVIPVCLNLRDPLGLINLQSEQTVLTLQVTFLADGSVATGATVTCTVSPYLILYAVPAAWATNPQAVLPLNVVHQILEEQTQFASTGQQPYNWPRGNRYTKLLHGYGFGVAGADAWTSIQLRVNQSDFLRSTDQLFYDLEQPLLTPGWSQANRLPGTLGFDFLFSAGLGNYDKTRDVLDSSKVTDLATVFNVSSTGTLYSVKNQLVAVG